MLFAKLFPPFDFARIVSAFLSLRSSIILLGSLPFFPSIQYSLLSHRPVCSSMEISIYFFTNNALMSPGQFVNWWKASFSFLLSSLLSPIPPSVLPLFASLPGPLILLSCLASLWPTRVQAESREHSSLPFSIMHISVNMREREGRVGRERERKMQKGKEPPPPSPFFLPLPCHPKGDWETRVLLCWLQWEGFIDNFEFLGISAQGFRNISL